MGKIPQGILGGVSGSVGNVTGGSWKGIAYLRSKPLNVSNPQTSGQVSQRSKFAYAVSYGKQILTQWIKPLVDRFTTKESGFNWYVSQNTEKIMDSGGFFSPAAQSLTIGNMEATQILTATVDLSNGNMLVTWADDTGQGFKLADDEAYLCGWNRATQQYIGAGVTSVRADLSAQISVTDIAVGNQIDCFLAFRRQNGQY